MADSSMMLFSNVPVVQLDVNDTDTFGVIGGSIHDGYYDAYVN
jgi:ABC-type oligopeptide transport system ATPase subunit